MLLTYIVRGGGPSWLLGHGPLLLLIAGLRERTARVLVLEGGRWGLLWAFLTLIIRRTEP